MNAEDVLQKVTPVRDLSLDTPVVAPVRPTAGDSPPAKPSDRTATSPAFAKDPFFGGKWKIITALVNLFTFALLATDVPRSGVKTDDSKLKPIGQGVWNFFGPFAYTVSYFHSQPGDSTVVASSDIDGKNIVTTRRAWSYKYDTTSITMRAIAASLDAPKGSTLSKLTYRSHGLNPVQTFPAVDAFHLPRRDYGFVGGPEP
ncbi:hypothetical protein PINS_up003567 [Pythium insidiosum]|nr:hypothetical protein PINS_up003567 [Pythium insidiosum]